MEKIIRLFDYKNRPKEITVENFDNVKVFVFQILSGDGVLTVIYKDKQTKVFDSCDIVRNQDFNDGLWVINPEDIDVLNKMKDHYDTEELDNIAIGL